MEPQKSPALDALNTRVTEAIFIAEGLERDGDPTAPAAFAVLYGIEAEIAAIVPHSDLEGAVARRGAVNAAVKAGDIDGARGLVGQYSSEPGIAPELAGELQGFLPE